MKNLAKHGYIAATDTSSGFTSKIIRGVVAGRPVVTAGKSAVHRRPDVQGQSPVGRRVESGLRFIGQYYRYAIGQAVLYREFIRRAKWLQPWFLQRGLDPTNCQAAIAFPAHPGDQRALQNLAAQFAVRVLVLPS